MDTKDPEKQNTARLSNSESNRITRECIQTALAILLESKDLEHITISELVKKAGVSRTAFYRNYNTKQDIIDEIVELTSFYLSELVYEATLSNDSYPLFLTLFDYIRNNEAVFMMLLKNSFYEKIAQLFEEDYPLTKSEARYIWIGYYGMLRDIQLSWCNHGMKESNEEMARICSNITSFMLDNQQRLDENFSAGAKAVVQKRLQDK